MMPVPKNDPHVNQPTPGKLDALFADMNVNRKQVDCILIRKQEAISAEARDECFNDATFNFFKKFPNRNVVLTYNINQPRIIDGHHSGMKFNTPTRKQFRKIKRSDTDNGVPSHHFKQVGVEGNPLDMLDDPHPTPFFRHHLLEEMKLDHPAFPERKRKWMDKYRNTIKEIIAVRQKLIMPARLQFEQDYNDATTYAEKLADLFHAYTNVNVQCPHNALAKSIANSLYQLASTIELDAHGSSRDNTETELNDCLSCISNHLSHNRAEVDPKGSFQALIYAAKQLFYTEEILQVAYKIKEDWDEKITALSKLAEQKLDIARKSCVDNLILELQRLKKEKMPTAMLFHACAAITEIVKKPSPEAHLELSQVISDMGKHSWGKVFAGLGLQTVDLISI